MAETDQVEPHFTCSAIVYPQTRYEPAEYCDNDCVDGEDFCEYHLAPEPDEDDYDPYDWPYVEDYEEFQI